MALVLVGIAAPGPVHAQVGTRTRQESAPQSKTEPPKKTEPQQETDRPRQTDQDPRIDLTPRGDQEQRLERLPRRPDMRSVPGVHARSDLLRRVQELDRLITLGSVNRAESLLRDLEQHSFLQAHLTPHRIRLAQLKGEHEVAVDLCREALATNDRNPQHWRQLATSLLALGRPAEAREALARFIATSPNRRSAFVVAVESLRAHAGPGPALAMIDSARVVLNEPRFLGRERALSLLELDRQLDAADELAVELRERPFNLPLIRTGLLDGPFVPERHAEFVARLENRARQSNATAAEAVLVANLHLHAGAAEPAIAVVDGLYGDVDGATLLLQDAATLVRELPLMDDEPRRRAARTDYLLHVLRDIGTGSALGIDTRRRALDSLARVLENALVSGDLGADPQAAVVRYEELLQLVKHYDPRSPHLYAAQIRLAHFTRDVLREPRRAAARLERLLTDLDLPVEGVALARLTLGECYLAAGDTARGRLVLTRLGKDPEFREAAGYAHFHVARLDLAEGHYATARDRFAAVALDNPAAGYANDALELGLAVAEELENPTGGPAILDLYAAAVFHQLTARPDSQRVALESFVAVAPRRLDLEADQYLLERARLELAELYHAEGRVPEALEQLERIVLDHPDGRYAAAALARTGEIQTEQGDGEAARQTYERLLLQYPAYLFGDDVREILRSLP